MAYTGSAMELAARSRLAAVFVQERKNDATLSQQTGLVVMMNSPISLLRRAEVDECIRIAVPSGSRNVLLEC